MAEEEFYEALFALACLTVVGVMCGLCLFATFVLCMCIIGCPASLLARHYAYKRNIVDVIM